uniref:DUF3817 domain-containing protein n=1 Tax=Janibacter limosus TaxID=53458 RepID=A0AC61U2R0_9MICO|nr:DUF3817 domain-containing protein [Janibacter limosus]
MTLPSPRRLYMIVATAEAVTWTLLLIGMFLKYVTKTTELGVRVGGMLHGIVFIAYVLVTIIVWVDRKWPAKQGLVALASAIPPLLTLWTERWLDRDGHLPTAWRLPGEVGSRHRAREGRLRRAAPSSPRGARARRRRGRPHGARPARRAARRLSETDHSPSGRTTNSALTQ